MDRKIIVSVLVIALLGGLGIWLLLPKPIDEAPRRLPWQTGLDAGGRLQIFGFTLGATTLAEIQGVFGETGKLTLFVDPDQDVPSTAEVYFERIYLNGLRADFIFTLEVEETILASIAERGLRISQLGDGTRKIKPAPADREALADTTIDHITYLPMARLDQNLLEARFGKPQERRTEANGIVHWLYPDKGIDIARQPNGRVVIQYVDPAGFGRLRAPLVADQTTAASPEPDHR